MNNAFKLSLMAAALAAPSAFAADKEESSNIKVSAELGILVTTGNTETSSYLGKLTIDHELENWKNKYTADYLLKEAEITDSEGNKETVESDNRYTLTGQADYKFTDKSAAFVRGGYTKDEYGAYNTYTSLAGGYSFRALEKEKMFLDLNAGAGFANSEDQAGETDDSAVYRGAAAFEWQINDMTKFVQNVSVEHAPDLGDDGNTRTITETGVSASFSTSMQMKFTYKTTTNSEVAEGFEKTDTETSVTLVVNF